MLKRILILVIFLGLLSRCEGADWPQWRGPNRDGYCQEKGLLKSWPEKGLQLLWQIDSLGAGYSGVAIVGDHLFAMGSSDQLEQVICLSAKTGKELWRTPLGEKFKNQWGDGPRGTPTVDRDNVDVLGAQGVLACLKTSDGSIKWKTDLRKEHSGKLMRGNILDLDWGYAESPLVHGNQVVVSPGGEKGTVAAFETKTGKMIWRTKAIRDSSSYASAILTEIHGIEQYVVLTGGQEYDVGALMKSQPRAIAISPKDGAILWQHKIQYITAGVINTPVVSGDIVYTSCGYGAGCTILRIKKTSSGFEATDISSSEARKTMKTYHGGMIASEKGVIGFSDGRGWVHQELPSGKTLWEEKGRIGEGSILRLPDRLLIVTMDGQIVLAESGEKNWSIKGKFRLPGVSEIRKKNDYIKVCTHPVIANGQLYIRDQEILYCFAAK